MGKASAMVAGALVALLGIWALSNSFSTQPACPYNDETPTQCQKGGGRKENSEAINFMSCQGVSNQLFGVQLQAGMVVNYPMPEDCWVHECKGGCLKVTQKCDGDGLPRGRPQYECVGGATTQDVRPLALFVYLPMILVGMVMIAQVLKLKKLVVVGILFMAAGWYMIERSITIVASCNYDDMAYCGQNGANGTRYSPNSVTLASCSGGNPTPFASNLPASDSCRSYGCDAKQCMSTTTPCDGSANPSFACVDQRSTSGAEPVNLFIGIVVVFFGMFAALLNLLLGSVKASGGEDRPLVT